MEASSTHPTGETNVEPPKKTLPSRTLSFAWWFARDQWFIIMLLILILVASQVQAPNQQLRKTAVQYSTVTVIFLINGCTVSTAVLMRTLRLWHLHVMIQCGCFLFTSATALAVVQAAATKPGAVDAALLNGFVVMACLPTALSFNVIMTKKSNGNDALTLTESVLGSVIAPALSTVLITTYASIDSWYTAILPKASTNEYSLIFQNIFKQLGLTLFLPLVGLHPVQPLQLSPSPSLKMHRARANEAPLQVVGQLLQYFFPKANEKVMTAWRGRRLASFALLVLIWSAFDGAFASDSFSTLRDTDIAFLVLVDIGLLIFWMTASLFLAALFLSREDAIAVAVSDVVATKLYLPMIIFQCVQTCLCSLATIPLKKWQANLQKAESGDESVLEASTLPDGEETEPRLEKDGKFKAIIPAWLRKAI
ncbi:hypothetical protein PG994_008011 [Apiospora phragmitis]|uniref:Uncharacterized protein n=1 Tax=Apiospora phragmitis TaxID=2905665 RepID=A0ABR1URU5_9PEZI